jgi:hypothetical protein
VVPAGLQQAAGWPKARAACLDALADLYTALLSTPALPSLQDRLAADEVRGAAVDVCPLILMAWAQLQG